MTVYVIQGTNKHKTSYHDEPNSCQSTTEDTQLETMTEQEAKDRGFTRCKWCAGNVDNTGADFSYQQALQEKAKEYAAGGD